MGVRLTDPIPVPFPRAAPSPGMTMAGMTIAGMTTTTPSCYAALAIHPFACEGDCLPPVVGRE